MERGPVGGGSSTRRISEGRRQGSLMMRGLGEGTTGRGAGGCDGRRQAAAKGKLTIPVDLTYYCRLYIATGDAEKAFVRKRSTEI